MQSASSRQQVLEAIANLSDQQLSIVLKFIQTIQSTSTPTSAQPSSDPLTDFIGANNHGTLAHAIDEALYD